MDDLDYAILSQLLRQPTASFEQMSRQVGASRNAVARRVRLLERSPLRVRFFGVPHFSLFERRSFVFLFRTDGTVDGETLLRVPGVIGYDLNHDGLLAITAWFLRTEEDSRPPAELEHLFGAPMARFTDATPGPTVPHLSRLEWKVMRAMIDAPRATAVALARATGLSARTCTRTRKRLIDGKYIQVGITVLEDRSGGFPVFRVYVQGKVPADAIVKVLGPSAVQTDTVEEGRVFMAKARSTGEIMGAVGRLGRLAGVDDVKLILSLENALAAAWLKDLCDERIRMWGSARAAASRPS